MTQPSRAVYWGMLVMIMAAGLAGGLGAPLVSALARAEQVPLSVAQWSVTANMLVAAVAAPVVGRFGGGGRQRSVLITLMSVAAFGTLLAALSLGIGWTIFGRALQGLAIAAQPLMIAVGRAALAPGEQARGTATLSAMVVGSAGLGFPVAALLGQLVGVHGAFWFGTALLSAALLAALIMVPKAGPETRPRLDLIGAFLLGLGTLSVLLAIGQSRTWGYLSPAVLTLGVLGIVLLGLSVAWLLRVEAPLVDLRLARHPVVLACHLAGCICGMGMYMMLTLCFVLAQATPGSQHGLGLSIAIAGLLMLPYSVMSVLSNRMGLWLERLAGPGAVLAGGCTVFAVALVGMAWAHHQPWQLFAAMAVGGLGSGLSFTSIPGLMMAHVPEREAASALSLNIVVRFVGFCIGSVLVIALLEAAGGADITHAGVGLGAGVAAGLCALAAVLVLLLLGRRPRMVTEP